LRLPAAAAGAAASETLSHRLHSFGSQFFVDSGFLATAHELGGQAATPMESAIRAQERKGERRKSDMLNSSRTGKI
jgi:hypothetical protein